MSPSRSKTAGYMLAVLCLLIFFALALNTAVSTSPTIDEPMHLFRGVAIWQTGNFQFQHNHPPLAHRLIGALPVLLEPTVPDVTTLPSWSGQDRNVLSREFLWSDQRPALARFVLLGRLSILFSGLLLGAMLMRWAADLGGSVTVATAGILFALAPNAIAHFSLATTDGILTTAYLATLFALHRYWQRPSLPRFLFLGLALGLALAAKLTAALLFPIILLLAYWRRQRSAAATPWWAPLRFVLLLAPLALLVIWVAYGFAVNRPALLPLPLPLPAATYLDNIYELLIHSESGYRAFLLGDLSADGWWYYFLVAFGVKTPVLTLVLLALTTVAIWQQRASRLQPTAVLWLPALVLFLFASMGGINIGYRHIVPMLPLLWLLAALGGTWLWSRRMIRLGVAVLLLVHVSFVLAIHPHHLAYFNWLAGGPAQGHRYLGDSNLDWGQSLDLLADAAAESKRPFHYAYFGAADPAAYGLTAPPLIDEAAATIRFAPANPAPGTYAISVSYLQGIHQFEPDAFDWFRRQEPDGHLGYNIQIFEVDAAKSGDWIATCLSPPLSFTAAERLLGGDERRHVNFDCSNSWVFPDGGAPGWYVLPQGDDWLLPTLVPHTLVPIYEHNATSVATGYVVYYWPGEAALAAWLATLSPTAVSPPDTTLALPQTFAGAARLHGYGRHQNQWFTVWQALRQPDEPVSIAGHLYVDPAAPPLVADGLGYGQAQWRPGDFWVQQHAFADGSGRYLETGLYTLTDGRRLPLDNPADAAFVRLPSP